MIFDNHRKVTVLIWFLYDYVFTQIIDIWASDYNICLTCSDMTMWLCDTLYFDNHDYPAPDYGELSSPLTPDTDICITVSYRSSSYSKTLWYRLTQKISHSFLLLLWAPFQWSHIDALYISWSMLGCSTPGVRRESYLMINSSVNDDIILICSKNEYFLCK